jgi:putative salt-induced outer membrane protein YdiY
MFHAFTVGPTLSDAHPAALEGVSGSGLSGGVEVSHMKQWKWWMAAGVVGAATSIASAQDDAAARAQAARDRIAALEAQLASEKAALEAAESQVAVEQAAAGIPEEVYTPSWLDGWKGSVDVGLNGSDGNSDQLSFRTSVNAKRTTERYETTFLAAYHYAKSDGEESANRLEIGLRNDWLFKDSRWRLFAQGKYESDQFADWDHRLSGIVGVGYEFIKNSKTTLLGRVGVGGSYEIGGDDEEFRPEALLGLDFAHQLTERQKLVASTEYFPDLSDLGEFRWNNRAAWEIMVDPETNLFMRVGAEHRHDSQPGTDRKHNDLDYFLTLGWSF